MLIKFIALLMLGVGEINAYVSKGSTRNPYVASESASNDLYHANDKTIVLMQGLSGSGKSLLCRTLVQALQNKNIPAIWLNQDESGNRQSYLRDVRVELP